jgi:hypothetical protein
MKWFHHDTEASQDPGMQLLGNAHGATGFGIYWSIIERIGYHSETFRLKVSGLSDEADRRFAADFRDVESGGEVQQGFPRQPEKIPDIQFRILAKTLFTGRRKLKAVIRTCVGAGLFDEKLWTGYNILYSATLESGADTYTQRRMRRHPGHDRSAAKAASNVRTMCEQPQNNVRTLSDNVPPEQEAEEDRDKKKHNGPVRIDCILESLAVGRNRIDPVRRRTRSPVKPSTDEFKEYCLRLRGMLLQWNSSHTSRFEWAPTEDELKTLFYAGAAEQKEAICYQAMNVVGGELSYPEVVLRAVQLMLDASMRTRIRSPMAWLWCCLHGDGKGKGPWAQLTTAEEERERS